MSRLDTGGESQERETESVPLPPVARIARLYAPQLERCQELLEVAWQGRPNGFAAFHEPDYRIVLLQIFGRALGSFRGVLVLLEQGLSIQALMLCRSLYEDLVAARWCCIPEHQEGLVEKIIRQEQHDDELYERVGADLLPNRRRLSEQMTNEEWKELDQEFSGGRKSWFGHLGTARDEVLQSIPAERSGEARTLRYLGSIANRRANMMLHNTFHGLALGSGHALQHDGRVFLRYGQGIEPDEEMMRNAFLAASLSFVRIAGCICGAFELEGVGLRAADARVHEAIFELMPSKRRRRFSANDRCWCGSGLKLKKCHVV